MPLPTQEEIREGVQRGSFCRLITEENAEAVAELCLIAGVPVTDVLTGKLILNLARRIVALEDSRNG